MFLRISLLVTACTVLFPLSAAADQVFLKNGDRLSGKVTQMKRGMPLGFYSNFGADMDIPWDTILSVYDDQGNRMPYPGSVRQQVTTAPLTSPYGASGRIGSITRPPTPASSRAAAKAFANAAPLVMTAPAAQTSAQPSLLEKITPNDFEWSGRVNLGGNLQDGNSNKKAIAFDAEVKARVKKNRFTFTSDMNWASDEGEETENDRSISGEYDRFLTDKWFIGGRQSFKTDKIARLDIRSKSGLFGGYQFFEQDDLNLQAKLGPDYIHEKFENGDREDNIAAAWALDYDQKFFDGKLQLFHNHDLAVPMGEADAFLFESASGVRVPLGYGVVGSGEIQFDWDNAPAPGVREEDTTYSVKLGYEW